MPKAISCNPSTGQPVNTPQQQENTVATPTDAALGDAAQPPNSSPIYFPPADPFESEEEPEVPAASMAVSEPQQSERGTVTAVTSARKTKYTGQKKSGTNLTQRQPSRPTSKRQTIAAGKRVFVERKIVKYRLDVDSPGYEVVQLYQSDKFRFYGTVVGKPANSKLYKVQLDLLPSDANEVFIVRKDITVLAKGEEEPPYNPQHEAMVDNCGVVPDRPAARKSRDHIGDSYNAFSKLESGLQAMASSFEMTYGDGSDDKIIWRVLSEKEQITVKSVEGTSAGRQYYFPPARCCRSRRVSQDLFHAHDHCSVGGPQGNCRSLATWELLWHERVSQLRAVHPKGLLQGIHVWITIPVGREEVLGC
jgi:hypothetical protein